MRMDRPEQRSAAAAGYRSVRTLAARYRAATTRFHYTSWRCASTTSTSRTCATSRRSTSSTAARPSPPSARLHAHPQLDVLGPNVIFLLRNIHRCIQESRVSHATVQVRAARDRYNGKTNFAKRHITGNFKKKLLLKFHTNRGAPLQRFCTIGQKRFGGPCDGCYIWR